MMLDFLILLLAILLIAALVPVALAVYFSMPLVDVLNLIFRRIGLAGPSPESRAAGVRGLGTVDEPFTVREGEDLATGKVRTKGEIWNATCDPSLAPTLVEGDAVEFVYEEGLELTVLGKPKTGGRDGKS
jgi:membrane protein implicated in regulation of membrane protease activity